MRHVAIIIHEYDRFEGSRYFLRALSDYWRQEGTRITLLRGTKEFVPADLAILHVDRTIIPEEYLEFAARFPRTLNAKVSDISKRRISSNLISRDDRYDGPVIVKTNRNYGGRTEVAAGGPGRIVRRLSGLIDPILPWSRRSSLDPFAYPIFDSPADVPKGIWENPRMVIERFRPEKSGDLYCLRTWLFLGDRHTHAISYSPDPIVKLRSVVRREALGEIPPDLIRIRAELGFDFGKFDYVIDNGEVVLYDANLTPTLGAAAEVTYRPRLPGLAEGIGMYFEEAISR